MSLRSALVDKARIVRKQPAGPSVLGNTPMAPTYGEWFRVRLELPEGPEDASEQGIGAGRRKAVRRPTLLMDRKDAAGQPVAVSFSDRLDIDSKQLGRGTWRVTGSPAPIRKKRKVIGWTASAERVEERDFREA